MRVAIVLVAIAALAHSASAQARQPSGNDMLPGCQDYAAGRVTVGSGECTGYFDSVRRAMGELPTVGVCVPDGVVQRQMAQVVVKYLNDHPERLQMEMDLLALAAFRLAWPCR